MFLCSFALKSPLFCLQILIRCSQKETVWHWRARHQQKVYTISKLKLGVSILKPPWKYCICVTMFVVLYCYSFSMFCFKTYFFTNVKGILIHIFILFLLFWWFLRTYFKHYINLLKQIETYIHKRLCQFYVISVLTLVKACVCDMFYLFKYY